MKNKLLAWLPALVLFACVASASAQGTAQPSKPKKEAPAASAGDTQTKNIREYIELLRENILQEKAELMGAVMQLSADDAAKFWPIYAEYNAELTKVNDRRVANIEEYARAYDEMTDEKADELVRNALEYRKTRSDLLAKYYDRVKQSLGAVTAARFLQIEDQLLLLIDLQITSSLPLVGKGA
jgi:hypothetical protein